MRDLATSAPLEVFGCKALGIRFQAIIMKQRSSAFTLIELLVVIAIIAILAAILFPVFAQAKAAAKKAQTISQMKQAGTAMIIYTSDNDDLFPAGTVPDLSSVGVVRYRFAANAALTPAGWNGNAALRAEHELIWANATFPYHKNYDMLDMPGSSKANIPTENYGAAILPPRPVNYAYNGLLQYVSTPEIAAPSQLTLSRQGMRNESTNGAVILTPRLRCQGTGVCRYNPGGQPQADNPAGNPQQFVLTLTASFHTFGIGNVHVFSDSSAKLVKYADGNKLPFPASTTSQIPYQIFNAQGRIPAANQWFFRGMGGLRGANYSAAFTPDNTFGQ